MKKKIETSHYTEVINAMLCAFGHLRKNVLHRDEIIEHVKRHPISFRTKNGDPKNTIGAAIKDEATGKKQGKFRILPVEGEKNCYKINVRWEYIIVPSIPLNKQ